MGEDTSSARLLGFDEWDRREPLTGGRGEVYRAWKHGRPHVVKHYAADRGQGGARERAALHALAGAAGTPRLLAEADDPACVVISHLEGAGSLADALLGDDPGHADDALLRWAEALGALHGALAGDDADVGPERPARRAFVLHRLSGVVAAGPPALAAMAAELGSALRQRWGDVPLALAPAYR